jgi:hypothetical protein
MDDRQEIIDGVLRAVAEGKSLRTACKESGRVSKSAFLDWIREDKPIADHYARARDEGLECKAEDICELADEEPQRGPDGRVDSGWVQWQRNRVEARKWILAKQLPRKYGERIEHGVTESAEEVAKQIRDFVRAARKQDTAEGEVT